MTAKMVVMKTQSNVVILEMGNIHCIQQRNACVKTMSSYVFKLVYAFQIVDYVMEIMIVDKM